MLGTTIDSGIEGELGALRRSILRRIAPLVRAAGLSEHEVACTVDGTPAQLRVVVAGPEVTECIRHAMSVRVLDAVHADGRTFGSVSVTFDSVS